MPALQFDRDTISDFIGARVKKLFPGYGEFEGFVSKVDRNAKGGMPIHIDYEDGDKGWMTFDEFASIVLKGDDGDVLYKENKRKAAPSSRSAPPSKRSKSTPKVVDEGPKSEGRQNERRNTPKTSKDTKKPRKSAATPPEKDSTAVDTPAAAAEGNGTAIQADARVNGHTDAATDAQMEDAAPAAAADMATNGQAASAAAIGHLADEDTNGHVVLSGAEAAGTFAGPQQSPARQATPPASAPPPAKASETGIGKMLDPIQQGAKSQEAYDVLRQAQNQAEYTQDQPPTGDGTVELEPVPASATPPRSTTEVAPREPTPPRTTPMYPDFESSPPRQAPPRSGVGMPKYSQVVVHAGIIYISGQVAADTASPQGQTYYGQTQQVLSQLDTLLRTVGVTKKRLLQVRVYLLNMAMGRDDFNRAWLQWVDQDALPARTLVEGRMTREQHLVQIEAIAASDQS